MRTYANAPLGIDGDFSNLAVDLFFVISGFIITHVALRESQVEFIIKRLFRIYPPLVFSVLLIALASWLSNQFRVPIEGLLLVSPSLILQSTILLNRLGSVFEFINPVTWSLVTEMLFYGLMFLLLPIFKRSPRGALIVQLLISVVLDRAFHNLPQILGWDLRILAQFYTNAYPLLLSQVMYLFWSKRIGGYFFGAMTALFWVEYVHTAITINRAWTEANPNFMISFSTAYFLFVILLLMDGRIRPPRVFRFLSDISYSLYLNHDIIGWALLGVLYMRIGYTWSLMIVLPTVLLLSYFSFRMIEQPSQQLARWSIRGRRFDAIRRLAPNGFRLAAFTLLAYVVFRRRGPARKDIGTDL